MTQTQIIVAANTLAPGDKIFRQHKGETYTVIILSEAKHTTDRFGLEMLTFRGEILAGPDRIGEQGELPFGLNGVAQKDDS